VQRFSSEDSAEGTGEINRAGQGRPHLEAGAEGAGTGGGGGGGDGDDPRRQRGAAGGGGAEGSGPKLWRAEDGFHLRPRWRG
jgi:hypothetical protein